VHALSHTHHPAAHPIIPPEPIIPVQPWLPIMAWQCCIISVRHSEIGLADRRQTAICSCRVAILPRISLVGADGALGLAAKAALVSAIMKAPVIAVAMRRVEFDTGIAFSFTQRRSDR
jgi:hypothetical protein